MCCTGHYFSWIYRLWENKWYFDKVYDVIFVTPAYYLALFSWRVIDEKIIGSGVIKGSVRLARWCGLRIVSCHTGYIQHYALAMLLGLVFLMFYIIQLSM